MTDMHGLKPNVWPNTPYNVTAQIRGDIREIVQREIEQVTIGTIGAETPAGAQEKVDTSAASLTAAIAAAKAELQTADALLAPLVHTHDDRYYLKAQVDASLAGKAAAVHSHNDLYYTEVEVDALIAGVSGGAGWTPVNATTTTKGIVELATTTETTTGTDTTRAVTPAGVKAALDAKTVSDTSTYVAQANLTVTPGASVSGSNTGDEPDASETVKGIVELATTAEASAGTDATRAVTPAGVAAAIAGVGGGVTDHGALSGLADDDHTQYALADGTRGMFAATSHTHTASQISDSTATGRTLITAATAAAARTAISAAPALGSDDNYVTDAEKDSLHSHANKSALDQVSGINTGDQVLPTWSTIDGKPAVVAAGATQADARAAIGAGTSSLVIGTTAGTAKSGDYAPDLSGLVPIAQPRNAQTGTAYTLVASDAGKIVTLDNAAAITVTVPASTIAVPTDTVVRVDFLVLGTGMPTFVGSGGMTINADPSLVADAQYAGLSLLLLSATSGVLVGRLATP